MTGKVRETGSKDISYLTLPTPLKDLFTSNDFVIRTFIVSSHILYGIAWAEKSSRTYVKGHCCLIH